MSRPLIEEAVEIAAGVVSRPEFDGLHDPDKRTAAIEPYYDPVGLPTIGYGHLLSRIPWAPLSQFPAISVERAEGLLRADLSKAANAVVRLVKVQLNANQLAALIDFVFNAGAGNFEISTLRRVINRGDFAAVPAQLMRWVYAKGVKLPGLMKRRRAEAQLWVA
ncbi:lysozyme [Pseudomonas juntendi]|uniref:lysozyme n=1 Tax=Pseudomonas juntendi TaxID=2666183 RepID=UPI0018DA01DE|nr:lysozyme [Pseudomonas juntendi]MBH3384701.1 lysozyme [Pseudomonas juntendi]MDG9921022.1 lysozyme [Pseudomonas juntendi]MDH0509526.1 lysozyme [Pseudomonas juntendi]MDH1046657.1 lysozyme [Pseudomonas juntendi]